jgi:hypothetical protein
MLAAAEFGTPIDQSAVDAAIGTFETAWGLKTEERPPAVASGASPLALAQALLTKYASVADAGAWTAMPDTDVALPPRGTNFVHIGTPGQAAVSADCPFTLHGDGSSLANCEASCLAADSARCNAINYSPVRVPAQTRPNRRPETDASYPPRLIVRSRTVPLPPKSLTPAQGVPDCVFRECTDPLHPQLSPGNGDYSFYGLNSTRSALIMTAWHNDVGVLSALCAADTACAGFTSDGKLYTDFSQTVASPGRTLYVKK